MVEEDADVCPIIVEWQTGAVRRKSVEVGIPVGPPRSKDGKVYGLTKDQWQTLIRLLIHKRHAKHGWVTFDEMRDGTGSDHRRTIDVFAFGIWPSTRYQRISYEIKTDRSDFMQEMRTPSKWKAWQELSNEFWYVTLPGVVKDGEIPEVCGHIEVQKSRLVIRKNAPWQDAGPIAPKLMASMLARMRYPTGEFYENVASIAYAGRWVSRKQFDQAVGHVVAREKYKWMKDHPQRGRAKLDGRFPVHDAKTIPASVAQDILSEVFSWFGDVWADENDPEWMRDVMPKDVSAKLYALGRSQGAARSALEIAENTIERALERIGRSKRNLMRERRGKPRVSLRARRRRRRRE